MLIIGENYVKDTLKYGSAKLTEIHNRIVSLYAELENMDALIRSISLGQGYRNETGSFSGNTDRDLTQIMIKHEKVAKQREIEIREEMLNLIEEEESINRIRVCYQTLRGNDYTCLQQLYVQRKPYKLVEKDSGMSHATFERRRRQAIKKIITMYESDYSNQELIALDKDKRYRKRTQIL